MDPLFPSFVLGALLSVGYASLYHVWNGQNLFSLGVYLFAAGSGFALGQVVGSVTQLSFLQVGQIYVLEASVVAWLALLLTKLFLTSK